MWCNYIEVLTKPQLGQIPVLFCLRDQISMWSITYQQRSTLSLGVCWHHFQSMRYYCRGMGISLLTYYLKWKLRYLAYGKQQSTKQQLYSHLLPIPQTIQVKRTRDSGRCLRRKDELMNDFLVWTPTHGHTSVDRPARTYVHQLSVDTGWCLEDLPGVMVRQRVRGPCAVSEIWWWWWWWWWLVTWNTLLREDCIE